VKDGGFVDYASLVSNVIYAIIPTVILCYYVYKRDVIEKEPFVMLIKLFFLGVLMTVPTYFMERSIISFLKITQDGFFNCFIMAFFIISLIEEGYKYLMLYLGTWNNRNFDYKYDAIVYAVFISLGFATLENILYVYNFGTSAAFLRALISVPAHAFYGIASGYFFGLAKSNSKANNKKSTKYCLILALLVPIVMHGIFDFLLLTENEIMLAVFYAFVAILYSISFFSVEKVSKTEQDEENKKQVYVQQQPVQTGMVNPLDLSMANKQDDNNELNTNQESGLNQ
jgi:RsiW-degrading membrane proteinase PrsW (M82 family)